jgi:hypothetical protein
MEAAVPWTPDNLPHNDWVRVSDECCKYKMQSGYEYTIWYEEFIGWQVMLCTQENEYIIKSSRTFATFHECIDQCAFMYHKFNLQGYR